MAHEHQIPVYNNCTIEIIGKDNNFDFLSKVKVSVKDTNGIVSESFILDAYTDEANLFINTPCKIANYNMKFPKNVNDEITWFYSNMASFFKDDSPLVPDEKCKELNFQFNNPNVKLIVVTMTTKYGRPLCIPQGLVNITTKNSFRGIIPPNDVLEPEKKIYPMVGYHDPRFFGSNPHLSEQVFGFYLITEDKNRINRHIDKDEFSYEGAIGFSSKIGYFISI